MSHFCQFTATFSRNHPRAVILVPYETLGLVIADKRFGLRVEGEAFVPVDRRYGLRKIFGSGEPTARPYNDFFATPLHSRGFGCAYRNFFGAKCIISKINFTTASPRAAGKWRFHRDA